MVLTQWWRYHYVKCPLGCEILSTTTALGAISQHTRPHKQLCNHAATIQKKIVIHAKWFLWEICITMNLQNVLQFRGSFLSEMGLQRKETSIWKDVCKIRHACELVPIYFNTVQSPFCRQYFRVHFVEKYCCYLIRTILKFALKGPIDTIVIYDPVDDLKGRTGFKAMATSRISYDTWLRVEVNLRYH